MVTDKTRRSAFIEQNLGLVHACAGRFRGRGIEYDDLYSAGCMGLVKATDGFDEGRGVCFSTYAVPVILGEIKKLFREVLESLPEEDRLLIRLRFYANRTQSETAKVLHTTQVQISRRERKILRKMRERLLE